MENSKANKNTFWKKAQTPLILFLATITVALVMVMKRVDKPLQSKIAPKGIVSFELARKFDNSQNIVNSWSEQEKLYAAFGLGIDYLFLFAYSIFFAVMIFKVANALKSRFKSFARLGFVLLWGQFLAAALDATENFFLTQLLFGSQRAWFANYAFLCASLKFALILMAVVYILLGLVMLIKPLAGNKVAA